MKAEMVNGSVIGNYRVQQKLGETAECITYSGKTLDTQQEVWLKAMRQPPALIRLALPDFQGRTTKFQQLRHPHLCAVLDIVRDDQAFYVVTAAHPGKLLSEALKQKNQFSCAAALALIDQALDLLGYLHQQKITCIDLRPTNFFLSEDNTLQLADAGLIQLLSLENQTTAPETISALEYTAPERILYSKILGTKVDARADLYAIGVLFYELLTGQPPLTAASRDQMIRTQIEAVPPPLLTLVSDVPAPIEQIIFRALEKSPERRFAAAETMRTALQRAQAPEAGLAPLEPSLAFLMESLQLADAMPKAPPARAETGKLGKTEAPTKPDAARQATGKLGKTAPPVAEPFASQPVAEAAPSVAPAAVTHELPPLEPRASETPALETPTLANEKITLNDLFPAAEAESVPTVEIEITAESFYVTLERDDDRAFDELRARVRPARWPRKALAATAALGLMLLLGCSVYWMARPAAPRYAASSPTTVSALATQAAGSAPMPSATQLVAQASSQPQVAAASTAAAAPLLVAAAPARRHETPTPAPVPKPAPRLEPSPVPLNQLARTQAVRAPAVRVFKPATITEKERRKRAILESLSQ